MTLDLRAPARRAQGWPPGPPEVRWGLGAAVATFLVAQFLAIAGGTVVVATVLGGEVPDPLPLRWLPLLNLGLWIGYLGGSIVVSRLLGQGWGRDFGIGGTVADYAVAVVAAVATQLLAIPGLYRLLGDLVSGDPGASARDLVLQADTPGEIAVLVLAVVVMAPLAEESMFRGLLLSAAVRRFGLWVGILASSLVFMIVHQDPATWPGLLLFALVLSWLTARTGRLGPAIAAHAAFNLTTVVTILAGF